MKNQSNIKFTYEAPSSEGKNSELVFKMPMKYIIVQDEGWFIPINTPISETGHKMHRAIAPGNPNEIIYCYIAEENGKFAKGETEEEAISNLITKEDV